MNTLLSKDGRVFLFRDKEGIMAHEFDDNGVCIKCGFDGAEAYHLKAEIGADEYRYRVQSGEFRHENICTV